MILRRRWVLWFLSQVVLPVLKRLWVLSWVPFAKVVISDYLGSFQTMYQLDIVVTDLQ